VGACVREPGTLGPEILSRYPADLIVFPHFQYRIITLIL